MKVTTWGNNNQCEEPGEGASATIDPEASFFEVGELQLYVNTGVFEDGDPRVELSEIDPITKERVILYQRTLVYRSDAEQDHREALEVILQRISYQTYMSRKAAVEAWQAGTLTEEDVVDATDVDV